MKTQIIRCVAGFVLAVTVPAAHAEFVVVVGLNSPINSVTAEQAANIFLGKTTTLPGANGSVVPLDLPAGSTVREEFYSKVANKNTTQLATYRANLVFSGKGQLPLEVASAAELARKLNENPNAIGYTAKAALDKGLKAVLSP